jgi:hypothetical protein
MRLSFIKLLKTHVEKMSAFRLSMMLMKTSELSPSLQDVIENKGYSVGRKIGMGEGSWGRRAEISLVPTACEP